MAVPVYLALAILLVGTYPTMAQVAPTSDLALLSNLLIEIISEILPCHGPCIADNSIREWLLIASQSGSDGEDEIQSVYMQCAHNLINQTSDGSAIDFFGTPSKVCPELEKYVQCIFNGMVLPCSRKLYDSLKSLLTKLYAFLDCNVTDDSKKLNIVQCMVVEKPSDAFLAGMDNCIKNTGLNGSPMDIWTALYTNYVQTQGPKSELCRHMKELPECILKVYRYTVWGATCIPVEMEIMRQLADIRDKLNCIGNGTPDVLTCSGNPVIYSNTSLGIVNACPWDIYIQGLIPIITELYEEISTAGNIPDFNDLRSRFYEGSCSSINMLTTCALGYISSASDCLKTVLPAITNIVSPIQYHMNVIADTQMCKVDPNGIGPCQCPGSNMTTCDITTVPPSITEEITTTEATTTIPPSITEEITTTEATTTTTEPTTTTPEPPTTTTVQTTTSSSASSAVTVGVTLTLQQEFQQALNDPNSPESGALRDLLTGKIEESMRIKYGSLFIGLVNILFRAGSILVGFDIKLASKPTNTPDNQITNDVNTLVASALSTGLVDANGMSYSVEPGSVKVSPPITQTKEKNVSLMVVMLIVISSLLGIVGIIILVLCIWQCGGCKGNDAKNSGYDQYGVNTMTVQQPWPSQQRIVLASSTQPIRFNNAGVYNQGLVNPGRLVHTTTMPQPSYYVVPKNQATMIM